MVSGKEKQYKQYLESIGYGVIPPDQFRIDMEPAFSDIWQTIQPYTMTSQERGYGLYKSVEHIIKTNIVGDFVECGVWKGGSVMLMALTLAHLNAEPRNIYLYDTFSGMTEPGDEDVIAWNNLKVKDKLRKDKKENRDSFAGWSVGLDQVRSNLETTEYPKERCVFVPGDVEETLDHTLPEKIALLRLDTDWYESTKKELQTLYPLLSPGGVLIIDDYGHFQGARKAVDEYFIENPPGPLLSRVDYTGRVAVKP